MPFHLMHELYLRTVRKGVHVRMQQVLVLSNQQQTTDAMIQACAAIGAELDKPDEYMKEHDRIIDECKKKLSDTLKLFVSNLSK